MSRLNVKSSHSEIREKNSANFPQNPVLENYSLISKIPMFLQFLIFACPFLCPFFVLFQSKSDKCAYMEKRTLIAIALGGSKNKKCV